jgi:sec-independent protein translocase protein TatC
VIGALLQITNSIAEPVFGIEATINLVLLLFLAFALIFQTPVVMVLLARIGLINSTILRTNRKYIGFGIMVVGAVLAPDGSPLTMMLLAGPMYVLFESSIWIIVLLERSWKRAALSAP